MNAGWFSYFWSPPGRPIPAGLACGLYTPAHLATLAGFAVAIAVLCVVYRRASPDRRRTMRLVVGILAFVVEAFRHIALAVLGLYTMSILPLHVCGFATIALIIDAIRPNSWLREYLYALASWGAVAALLFPNWVDQPWFNAYTWQSFLAHGIIVAYIAMLLVGRDYRPALRHLWRAVIIMAVLVGVSALINHYFGTNFWYLNAGSPGSPLEPIHAFAGAWYVPVLAGLLCILWVLMYIPWELVARRRRQ